MKRFGSLFSKPKPRTKDISRKRWNWPSIIGRAIKRACTVVGALVLFSIALSILITVMAVGNKKTAMPDDMILVFNTGDGLSETSMTPTLFDPFPFQNLTVHRMVEAIDRAAADDRVHGLVLNVDGGGLELAHIEEIRAAVERFRAAGKMTRAFSPSYGDAGGTGLGTYYLASAFQEIWMQPVGMLTMAGINIETPYARLLLDKIGANPEFYQREEYKNAMESFTASAPSPATQEMMKSIVLDFSSRMTAKIAVSRGMPAAQVKGLIDEGLFTGDEALKANLIDRLDYADVMLSEWRKAISGNPDDEDVMMVNIGDYAHDAQAPGRGKTVALVQASGMIVPYDTGDGVAAADRISDAIMDAVDDDGISVIVLRVDSPGGSPTASETIRRAVVRAREKGKRVVVSMGPVAASGGYWIAAEADRIFALPSTLTGSIGVVMGKASLGALWEKADVTWYGTSFGANSGIWSMNKPFSANERARIEAHMDDTYDAFLTRVATGRKMDKQKVREIAKGRAWTGAQAKEIGLVDELGGLDAALDDAAKGMGLTDRNDIQLLMLPAPETPIEQLMAAMGQQVKMGERFKALAPVFDTITPYLPFIEGVRQPENLGAYSPIHAAR